VVVFARLVLFRDPHIFHLSRTNRLHNINNDSSHLIVSTHDSPRPAHDPSGPLFSIAFHRWDDVIDKSGDA